MHTIRSLLYALWRHRLATLLALVLFLLIAFVAATYYIVNLPTLVLDRQQTIVLGPTQFAPENPSALRVVVRDSTTNQPVANASVTVRMISQRDGTTQTLYTGQTDARGTAPVSFVLPADTARKQTLIIETQSPTGYDRIERAVTVARSYKVLVTTDKPIYQPGQTIHLRALALGAVDRVPAKGQDIEFLIEDPKGNKIYRKTLQASDYGIVSADFQLAETVTAGDYKIIATLGETKSEKTVNVKPYVLPKFKVSVETERSYYLPGEKVTGQIRADYFFGKPVAQSDVTIKGVVYDVARAETINLVGKTDANGVYTFSFVLPNYFAATGLTRDRADFGLEVSVTDQANHTEQTSHVLPIASNPIIIDAVPESGRMVANVENIVYILTSLPDGSPLETTLTISGAGATQQTRTGKYGLAEITIIGQRGTTTLTITAQDAQGRRATRQVPLPAETTATQILLRPDRATYRVGETMRLDAFTTNSTGTVYLDILKERQTLSTRAEDAVSGRATIYVDVTPEMIGTLQLHAYHIERDGTITRDARIVVVEQPSELNIAILPDRDVYRPGDVSKVTFSVTDAQGKGVQSALGVAGVDEAVFALAEQDPGFAKLYFLLQRELLEPKYQVKGFTLPEVVAYQPQAKPPELRVAQTQSANAAWALATPFDFVLRANSQVEKRAAASKAQTEGFNNLAATLALVLSLVPLALAGFVVASLATKHMLGKSLALWLAATLGYCVASPFFIIVITVVGAVLLQLKLGVLIVALVALALIVAFAIVAAHAILKRDAWLQAALILLAAYFVLMGVFAFVAPKAAVLNEWLAFAVILTYLGALATVVLIGIGLMVQKETAPGLAALLLVLIFIPATILLAMLPNAGPFLRTMGHPSLYVPPAWLTGCAPAATPVPGQPSTGNLFRDLGVLGAKESAPVLMAAPTKAPAPTAAPPAPGQTAATEQPRVRQYFPETLYFNPQVITNENGTATLDIPLADSITTWRFAVTASSQRGELGAASRGIRVFQDFFVDLDLPVALTQNDEISVPVAVYNYLTTAQKVRVQIEKQSWFELQDHAEKVLTIAANDIDVVYFRIKALNFGTQKFKVTALGEKMSDAIQREIRVYPDGKPFEKTTSNWLKEATTHVVEIPPPAIPGASRVEVKIYPGIVSQVVNGLDGLLRMPFGCFEQTTSVTFPNVLVLNYLKQTKQASPEIQMKAEHYIALGYQRLLTFEVSGGGFSLYGRPPASVMLTAKGLLEFSDMAKVYPVDPALINRTRQWLLAQQRPDGTWSAATTIDRMASGEVDPLPLTAYVTWAILESGLRDDARITRAIAYIKENAARASDGYTLAMVANALVAFDPNDSVGRDALARLDAIRVVDGDGVYYPTYVGSFTGAYGVYGNIETTGLAAYAFLRAKQYPESAQRALAYLVQKKDARGTWGSTQATILALRALIESVIQAGEVASDATVRIAFNGSQAKPIVISKENLGVVHIVTFDDVNPGVNRISFQVEGKGALAYQVSAHYYLPWQYVPPTPEAEKLVDIQVRYDRTTLAVNDTVRVTADVRLTQAGTARMTIVDLGIPPGFGVVTEDLEMAVRAKTIARYELTARQIIIYLEEFDSKKPITFTYRLHAKFPLRAQTPSSTMYDYYNPSVTATQAPTMLTVK